MRKIIAVLMLAAALSIAPRVSAQDAEHWHPYLLAFSRTSVAVIADADAPDGYSTKDACETRRTEMMKTLQASNPNLKFVSRCTTNDESTELAEVRNMLGAAAGKDI